MLPKMSPPARAQTPASPFAVLGFTEEEEQLYRMVLRHSGSSLDSLAEMLATPVDVLRARAARLAQAGLVRVAADLLVAAPPDQALGALIAGEARRLELTGAGLDALRAMMPSFVADHAGAGVPRGEPVAVECIEGADPVALIRGLVAASSGPLLWLRPDQWRFEAGHDVDDLVLDHLRAGRPSRAIYPARVLEEAPQVVHARGAAGEQVRILGHVPSRLAVFGTSAALMTDSWGSSAGRRLIVRHEGLVAALTTLFELLWERAMTVPGLHGGEDDDGERRLLLDQLAAGAKDEQIARALGMSLRTVRRRVADILAELDADSRFQAGVEAVRRGWL